VSRCRQQGFIEAPADVVCRTYNEVVETSLGKEEVNLLIEGREELRNLRIRCLSTGTFIRFEFDAGATARLGAVLELAALDPRWPRQRRRQAGGLTAARRRWAIVDSNHGPRPYQRRALTN
jgi:hypothetical protein